MTNKQNTYEVAPQTWEAIKTEVDRLLPAIEREDDLTPDDVKEVRRLVKLVNDASTQYNKAITEASKRYKSMLVQKLNEIGYDRIDAYIAKRRKENQDAISNRLNEKVERFTNIVKNAVANTDKLKDTNFTHSIPSLMMTLYPNVNSGAASKDIKDWDALTTSVENIIAFANSKVTPLIQMVPAGSETSHLFGHYFTTGDRTLLSDKSIADILSHDEQWLREKVLASKLDSEATLLKMIAEIASENTNESLNQVRKLIEVWDKRHTY